MTHVQEAFGEAQPGQQGGGLVLGEGRGGASSLVAVLSGCQQLILSQAERGIGLGFGCLGVIGGCGPLKGET